MRFSTMGTYRVVKSRLKILKNVLVVSIRIGLCKPVVRLYIYLKAFVIAQGELWVVFLPKTCSQPYAFC